MSPRDRLARLEDAAHRRADYDPRPDLAWVTSDERAREAALLLSRRLCRQHRGEHVPPLDDDPAGLEATRIVRERLEARPR